MWFSNPNIDVHGSQQYLLESPETSTVAEMKADGIHSQRIKHSINQESNQEMNAFEPDVKVTNATSK